MRSKLKLLAAGAAALAVAGGGFLGLAKAASAAPTTPPWEPDPQAKGNIVFYDTSGNVVTSGTNLSHLFDYAAVTTAGESGAIKATLYFAAPSATQPTTGWATTQASLSTAYPSATAPAPLTGPGFTNPLVTLGSGDANLSAAIGGFVLDSSTNYANMIQVRVKTNSTPTTAWWETDIAYNNGSAPITTNGVTVNPGAWAQVYPVVTQSSVTLGATPPSPQNSPQGATQGQNVTLTANVSPGTAAGTVQFFDGTTAVGSPQTVSGGTASVVDPTPAFGTHSFTAKFIPTGGTEVQGSTSAALPYVINPPQTVTTVGLTGPASVAQYSPGSWVATIAEADSTTPNGTTAFNYAGTGTTTGTGSLGSVGPAAGGTATLNLTQVTLAPGTYNITATFTPTNNSYQTTTSAPVALTVTAPVCKGQPDPSGATCSDTQNIQVTVNPGSLTITTPYNSTNPYVLPAMQLNAGGTLLSTSARFPKAGDPEIVVHSSLAGDPNWTVSVTATDLNLPGTVTESALNTINGENLGLTGGTLDTTVLPAFPGTVSFTAIPAANGVAWNDTAGGGLKGGPHTFATSGGGGNGSASMYGTLTLNAPTSTQAGTYSGTVTFSVA